MMHSGSALLPLPLSPRVIMAATIALGIFAALTLVGIDPLIGLGWIGLFAGIFLVLHICIAIEISRDICFYGALILFFGLPLEYKLSGVKLFILFQLLLMVVALVGAAQFFRIAAAKTLLRMFLFCIGVYLLFGLLSTLLGRSTALAAGYQFYSIAKPVLLLAFGFALVWSERTARVFWAIVRNYWLVALPFVVWQWGAPGLYSAVFVLSGITPDTAGIFPSRGVATFEHPSFLAATASLFLIFCVAQLLVSESRHRYWLPAVGNFVLLVCAVQRQELVSAILASAVLVMLSNKEKLVARSLLALIFVVIGSVGFWELFGDDVSREAVQWGFSQTGAVYHPRAQIYDTALQIARHYFPLGSGLGTFGGAGAEKFDQSLYEYYGFKRFWWYGREDYLMDTYWPNPVAEAGFIGAFFLLLSYFSVIAYAMYRAVVTASQQKIYWLCAAGGTLFIASISLTSPAFQDVRLWFFPALLFGIAAQKEVQDHA